MQVQIFQRKSHTGNLELKLNDFSTTITYKTMNEMENIAFISFKILYKRSNIR